MGNKLLTAAETCKLVKKNKELEKIAEVERIIKDLILTGERTFYPDRHDSNPYWFFPKESTLNKLKELGYKIEYEDLEMDITSQKNIVTPWYCLSNKVVKITEKKKFKTLTISACCDSVPRPGVD